MRSAAPTAIAIPATALTRASGEPAVWVVDPADADRVAAQRSTCCASTRRRSPIGQGLATGDIVVTAGVQALRPGQKVRLLGTAAR